MNFEYYIYRVILYFESQISNVRDAAHITILAKNAEQADKSAQAMGGQLLDCCGGFNR